MSDLVNIETDGHLLLIGIDRQEKRNAWNTEIIREVAGAYTRLAEDPGLRVGVVYAEGDHFTAGLDLMDVLPSITDGNAASVLPPDLCDPWDFTGEPCPKPIVVAVQGRCYTLGIELILASQACVAADDTVFAQLEVARGIIPLGGGTFRLPARLGMRGKNWLLGAGEFTATEAMDAGLVAEVAETGRQLDRALEVARTIAANAPLAVQAALAGSRAAERASRDAAAQSLRDEGLSLFTSADAAEGLAAMMERREPHYTGK